MDDDITPQERKYVEVYEKVSHEIQREKDPALIARELMAEGYNEQDANQWVAAVGSQLRNRMVKRSLFALILGVTLLASGLVLRFVTFNSMMTNDSTAFGTFLIVIGAVLSIWGMSSWAKYRNIDHH